MPQITAAAARTASLPAPGRVFAPATLDIIRLYHLVLLLTTAPSTTAAAINYVSMTVQGNPIAHAIQAILRLELVVSQSTIALQIMEGVLKIASAMGLPNHTALATLGMEMLVSRASH